MAQTTESPFEENEITTTATDTDSTMAIIQEQCGTSADCQNSRFCDFNGGNTGDCTDCSGYLSENDCQSGLTLKGANDCILKCGANFTTTQQPSLDPTDSPVEVDETTTTATDTDSTTAIIQEQCGTSADCQNSRFCDFNGGNTGDCTDCSGYLSESDCQSGLTLKGANDCILKCGHNFTTTQQPSLDPTDSPVEVDEITTTIADTTTMADTASTESTACTSSEWQCGSGECIDQDYYCDGHVDHGTAEFGADCPDNSDEVLEDCCASNASAYAGVCAEITTTMADNESTAAIIQEPCGVSADCQSNQFCDFNGGNSGDCADCVGYLSENDCQGLTTKGANDCILKCGDNFTTTEPFSDRTTTPADVEDCECAESSYLGGEYSHDGCADSPLDDDGTWCDTVAAISGSQCDAGWMYCTPEITTTTTTVVTSMQFCKRLEVITGTEPFKKVTQAIAISVCGNLCASDIGMDPWQVCGLEDGQISGPGHGGIIGNSQQDGYDCWIACAETCEVRDSDTCLQSHWGESYTCAEGGYWCDSYAKIMHQCCPVTCGTGILTESECNAKQGDALCNYPNDAQLCHQDDSIGDSDDPYPDDQNPGNYEDNDFDWNNNLEIDEDCGGWGACMQVNFRYERAGYLTCQSVSIYDLCLTSGECIPESRCPEEDGQAIDPNQSLDPGNQEIISSFFRILDANDCDVSGDCVSSRNWPSKHGINEECEIKIIREALYKFTYPFQIEYGYDKLFIRGEEVDSEPSYSETFYVADDDRIHWSSDSSINKRGWQICFQEYVPPMITMTVTAEGVTQANIHVVCGQITWPLPPQGAKRIEYCSFEAPPELTQTTGPAQTGPSGPSEESDPPASPDTPASSDPSGNYEGYYIEEDDFEEFTTTIPERRQLNTDDTTEIPDDVEDLVETTSSENSELYIRVAVESVQRAQVAANQESFTSLVATSGSVEIHSVRAIETPVFTTAAPTNSTLSVVFDDDEEEDYAAAATDDDTSQSLEERTETKEACTCADDGVVYDGDFKYKVENALGCREWHTDHDGFQMMCYLNQSQLAHECPSVWKQPGEGNIYVRLCAEELDAVQWQWNAGNMIWVWGFGVLLISWIALITGCFKGKKKKAKGDRRSSTSMNVLDMRGHITPPWYLPYCQHVGKPLRFLTVDEYCHDDEILLCQDYFESDHEVLFSGMVATIVLADKGGRNVDPHKLIKLSLIFIVYVTFFEFGISALLQELPHIWEDKEDVLIYNLDLKIRQEMYDPYVVSFEFWLIARVVVIAFALFAVVDQSHAAISGFQAVVFLWNHISLSAKILAFLIPCILTYVNVWIILMYYTLIQTSESFLDIFLNYAAFQVFIDADNLLWKVAIGDKTPSQVYPSLRDMCVTSCSKVNGRIHSTLQTCFIMRNLFKMAKLQMILFISWFLVKGYYDVIDQPEKADVWLNGCFCMACVGVLYCFLMIARRCIHDADVRYHIDIAEEKVWVRPHLDDDDFSEEEPKLDHPAKIVEVSTSAEKRIGGEEKTPGATKAGSTVGGTRVDGGSIYDGIPIHGESNGEVYDYELGVE